MANSFQTLAAPVLLQSPVAKFPGIGSVVLASRRARPLWFDGRFLAAQDLQRDQDYFLQGQSRLGRAAGFGVIHGLQVDAVSSSGDTDPETIIVRAGQGLTPGGDLVMISQDLTLRLSDLPDEENLDVQFGISSDPTPVARTRTGLYVIALRPVQFTANPITAYPASIQGSRSTHDGDVVEATAVSLVPYPDPSSNFDATTRQAALARQIFVVDSSGKLSDSLLPLAMASIQRGVIEWVDPWLVRRDSGPESNALRFGLTSPATQQAFLLQYDAQLQKAAKPFLDQKLPARIAAADYFQALPPAGRFPLASIDTVGLTQLFFPQQTEVQLGIVPDDELPALIEDSLSLPPIDLTLPAASYADLAVFLLIAVPRPTLATLPPSLTPVQLTSALPQVMSNPKPLDLLRFFPSASAQANKATGDPAWVQAIGKQTYGYYLRRRSSPVLSTATALSATAVGDGTSLSVTVTLTPPSATGIVILLDGPTKVGAVNLNLGSASLVMPMSVGDHSLQAIYQGDANFATSSSLPVSVTIAAPIPKTATTVVLSVTQLPGAGAGLPFIYNIDATVTPLSSTGNVTLQEGAVSLASGVLVFGLAVLNISSNLLSNGSHSITAVYGGDNNFASSTSAPVILTGTGGEAS